MNDLDNRIKELRIAAGLTQEKLANDLGIAERSIQRYESGCRMDSYILKELANYFNVSADYLLDSKSYEKVLEEKNSILKGERGYNVLYSKYMKCLNDYEIIEDATYYWIQSDGKNIGGQTQWVGWYDDDCTLEIRKLRPVIPENVIKICSKIKERPMVINGLEDAIVYLIYGGQAVIKADICERYLPQFCEDYIVPIKYVGGYR